MTTYLLIIYMLTSNSQSITTEKFNTLAACEMAGRASKQFTEDQFGLQSVAYKCIAVIDDK